MRKRRSAKYKSYTAGEVKYTGASYGGGESKDDKFSVFEFADDDLRVETESRKTLARFGTRSPSKKPAHHHQSVDKYVFLECFSRGTLTRQNDSENNTLDVDVNDRDRTFETDVKRSPGSLNYKSHPFPVLKHQVFESPSGSISCEQRSRKPGRCTTGTKHNKVFNVDSDEDERMELRSPSSSFALADNAGSLKEQSSEYCSRSNDCEAVVVVAPKYVKYGDRYYTSCLLTFSQRCIRLEALPLGERKRPYCLEWLTFDISKIECQQYESVKADVVNLHFKSKDTNVAETGSRNSGTMELEFVVIDDPQWSEKQEEIKSLDVKYKASWETILSKCSFHESFEEIIYPNGDPDAVFISRNDIELLQPRTFINDTIIDFYIKYLLNKTKAEMQHRFHFFNTFFFRKLADMDQDLSRAWEGRDAFHRVRKWTRNVNLFEKDYIFIPVNFSLHWSLIVICHPGEVAKLRDKCTAHSSKVPCILHMDSIRGSHRGLENLIRSYLWEEWKERHNKQEEDISMKFSNLDFVALQLPQQENSFDCGLFLLHYAELFLEQALNFSATKYIDYLNQDWFHPAEVSLRKRDHIRKVIHRIVEDNAMKDPSAACNSKCLQSGMNEGDSSAQSLQENGVKESCVGIELSSSDNYEIKEQQSSVDILEQRTVDKSVTNKCCKSHKELVPINQFSNMKLPMEEGPEKQASSSPECTMNRYEADEDDKPMPCHCLLSSFRTGGIKASRGTSRTCTGKSPIIIDLQNDEECVPEAASALKERNDNSSMSSEDLAACVVEDSEEECGTSESIRINRRSSLPISPVRIIKRASYANTVIITEREKKC
ncbi:putative ubiquitin-like-specific protease 2B [Sesamum alatum]|uniref:Ubiquitin-like-specific protease 2B n=1 Tax=Sesamum alatum TaxID=300844 RepID=A0AAE1YXH1_9LAMI|nr:putative ubiquitin-like-specific protease 2B [Sesamum alatum]